MQIRTESKNNPVVSSPAIVIQQFQQDMIGQSDQWAQQLEDNPDDFADIEQRIDTHYRHAAGQLVASLLAQVTSGSRMDEHVENVRNNAALPLRSPQPCTRKIRLLCGLVLWVTTVYCAPQRTKATDPDEQLGKKLRLTW